VNRNEELYGLVMVGLLSLQLLLLLIDSDTPAVQYSADKSAVHHRPRLAQGQ